MLLCLHENRRSEIEFRRDEKLGKNLTKWNIKRHLEILPSIHWVFHLILKVYGLRVQQPCEHHRWNSLQDERFKTHKLCWFHETYSYSQKFHHTWGQKLHLPPSEPLVFENLK